MKKPLLITLCALLYLSAGAQNNNLKINLLALSLGNISLQHEYSINGKSSIALGVSYLPSRGVPGFAVSEDPSKNAENLSFKGFGITPEYRYYFKGNGPKGLYLAGYFRYSKYSTSEYDFNYDRDDGSQGEVTLTGDYTTTVVGVMLGSQWLLGDHFTLDWWIIGAGFGSLKGEYEGVGNFSDDDQTDIDAEVNTIDVPGVDIEVTTSANKVNLTVEPSIPAIRGFGLCLGYRF